MSKTVPEEIGDEVLAIVSQLNRGAALIDSLQEQERVAALNLVAANRAKGSTAYGSALAYLVAGRTLLAEESNSTLYSADPGRQSFLEQGNRPGWTPWLLTISREVLKLCRRSPRST
jgi:predicted ATPase